MSLPPDYEDELAAYARKFPVWDPMLTYDGQHWFMYILTSPQKAGQQDFFTKDNFIRGFVSRDLRRWKDLGTVIPGGFFGKRICAGSLMHQENRFHFFCSATTEQFGTGLIDQRIFLATSMDGVKFSIDNSFSIEPDPAYYGTTVFYPGTDRMMFAWRDPYVFLDPRSGKYYLFICAGGKRWGTPPSVAVAEADTLKGPYRLLPPAAVSSWHDSDGVERVPVWEMERAQVTYREGKYYMMFSVWEHFMDEDWKAGVSRGKEVLSQSAIVVLVSDNVTGPYRFDDSAHLIQKPPGRNLYGAMVVPDPAPEHPDFVVGWYPDTFTPEVSADIRIDWERETLLLVSPKRVPVSRRVNQLTPIFILGVPRSGTTLLRVLLDSHSCIAGPPETAWITGGYGERSLRELVDYLCDSELGPVKNLSGMSAETIITAARQFLETIFSGYLHTQNKQSLVLKTPDDIQYVEFLLTLFPDAKFIHIHRDGRDVACSTREQKGKFFGTELGSYGELTVISALERWHDWDSGLRDIFLDQRCSYLNISYENLVREPQAVLSKVTEFIGQAFEPAMIDYSRQEHEYPSWEAGSTGVKQKSAIDAGSVGRWRRELPADCWQEIDKLFGDYLLRLGYPRCKALPDETAVMKEDERKLVTQAARLQDYGVNLKNQIDEYFGNHRCGWAFAVQSLSQAQNPNGIYLNTFVEKTFVWEPQAARAIEEPWIGIIHIPPGVPGWFQGHQSNDAMFSGTAWKKSLPHCRGLYTLSEYHRKHLQKCLDVPVNALLHPTEEPELKWNPEAFRRNPNKSIIQVGWWLRVLHAIYELPDTGLEKILLQARSEPFIDELMETECEIRKKEGLFRDSMYDTVRVVNHLGAEDYDRLLSENIVFLNLYDASANNTVIECIMRNTPILVNPLEAVTEYLGEDYPLYYHTLEEAAGKAANESLLYAAHEYLKALPIKTKLTREYFLKSILDSDILKSCRSDPPIDAGQTVQVPETKSPDLVSVGEAAYMAGDIRKAEASFLEAYALDSTDIIACNNLVVLYWESGDAEKALAYLDAAMQLDSTNRDVVVNGGQILSAYGYEADAAGLYEAFLSTSPDDVDVQVLYEQALSGGDAGTSTDDPKADPVQFATDPDNIERIDYSLAENRARAPKISIVIPSFNQGAYLETTIRSVLDQNYPNLELIIMDGGSTDCSVKIIEKYEKHIEYWQSQLDEGQYWAVNEGFQRSTGELMAWINSDDKLHVNSLNTMASIFSQRTDVNWVTGTPNIMGEGGFITWICEQTPVFSQNYYLQKKYDFPSFIQQEGTFWRRSLWDQAGATLQTGLQMAGDLELWARFFRYSPLHTTTVCTGCFRQQKDQKTAKAMTLYRAEAEEVLDREIQLFNRSGRAPLAPVEPVHVHSPGRSAGGSKQLIAEMATLLPRQKSSLKLFSAISPGQKTGEAVNAMHGSATEPLVTAIVSTYNSEKYLRGCLDDLEAQSLASRLEIIVVDSGSRQSEGAIVKEYQERYTNIRYIRTESRETIYSAWNRAVKEARGKYLTNANTDDRHRSDAYERMVKVLEANRDVALVYADAIVTEQENAAFSDAAVTARFNWPEFDARHLFSVCYIGPQPMWRRSLHEQYGYFDPRMRVAGDYDFWLRLASHEKFSHLPEELGLYLSSENSIEHAFAGVGAQESEKARQRNWPETWGERPSLSQGYLVRVSDEVKPDKQVLPLVSVIMATKNRRDMLACALQSVQEQSYLNWEIVLVNDGGEDVRDVVQQLGMESRVRYLQNESSCGQANARNQAFKSATGEIFTILDDDDMYQPHHLQTVIDSLQDKNRYFIYTDAELVQETLRGGNRNEINRSNPYAHGGYSKKQLHIDNYIPINTWAFRKECLSYVNGFDESMNCCEDWDFLLKLAQRYEFHHIRKVTAEVRHRIDVQDNITRQRLSETESVYKEIYGRYREFDGPDVAQGRQQAIERIRAQLNRLEDEEGMLLPDSVGAVFSAAVKNDDRKLLERECKRFLERVETGSYHCPVVHLIAMVDEDTLEGLIDTICSLSDQFYTGWGLTVISSLDSPGGVFDELENLEWIKAVEPVEMLHEVIQNSIGEWVVPLGAGNRLAPNALSTLVEYSNQRQNWRFIYTDEIAGNWGDQTATYYKPDFDREYLLNNPYLGQLCFLRKDSLILDSMHGADSQTLGFEQCLRMTKRYGGEVVGHIPEVLNCRNNGLSNNEDSGLRREIYSRVLADYFSDELAEVSVVGGYLPDTFMIDYPLCGSPAISIVIYAVNNAAVARQTVTSIIDKTAYKNFQIRVGVSEFDSDVFTAIDSDRLQVDIVADCESRAAYINTVGMKSDSEYLLFVEPGILVIQDVWLNRLLAHGQRADIAALGVRLISTEQRLVHAGIVTGVGPYGTGCVAFEGNRMNDAGYMNRAQVAQSTGAVSGVCMLVRSERFAEVNGFDIELGVPFYQDVDFCQKLQSGGRRIVWTPYVTMLYTGPELVVYRGDKNAEYVLAKAEVLSKRWLKNFAHDPAYNRNLGLKQTDYRIDRQYPPAWNPDIRDIPRITGFGAGSRGSWQYRVVQPMKVMHREGVASCNQTPFVESHRMLLPTPVEIERAQPDTLLMHNMLHDDCIEKLEQYKNVNNAFVVFGQDDLMFALPPNNPFSKTMYKDVKKRIRRCLNLADRLLVTTDALADGLQGMADDIRVVPNYLDDAIWMDLHSRRQVSPRPRVGWAGAQQHLGDLLLLEEVVRETAGEVDWVFFGMCPDSLRPYVREVHDAVRFENYPGKLAALNLDLAVAPLEHNRFNEAKSNLRILEYGALGWPVIASDIEPYRNAPVCLVRSQPSAWINAIRDHLHDPGATCQAGDQLRVWVQDHWMLQQHLTEWLSALDKESSAILAQEARHHAIA